MLYAYSHFDNLWLHNISMWHPVQLWLDSGGDLHLTISRNESITNELQEKKVITTYYRFRPCIPTPSGHTGSAQLFWAQLLIATSISNNKTAKWLQLQKLLEDEGMGERWGLRRLGTLFEWWRILVVRSKLTAIFLNLESLHIGLHTASAIKPVAFMSLMGRSVWILFHANAVLFQVEPEQSVLFCWWDWPSLSSGDVGSFFLSMRL